MRTLSTPRHRFVALALICLSLAAVPVSAQTTYTVTKTADTDDGVCNADCSLREAIAAANADFAQDLIVFRPSLAGQTIALAPGRGQLVINQRVTIDAEALDITVDARGQSRVFLITPGPIFNEVSLIGLTITGGQTSGTGGGILTNGQSEIALTRCTVTGNRAAAGGGGVAGDYVFVYESTISDNETSGDGGGILSFIELIVQGSTISENNSGGVGGGIGFLNFIAALDSGTLSQTTVTRNNSQGPGGGLYVGNDGELEQASGLIIAGNTRNRNPNASTADCEGPLSDGGNGPRFGGTNNVVGEGTGCGNAAATVAPEDVFTRVLDPLLADNGGPTKTHALLAPGGDPSLNPAITLGAGAVGYSGVAPPITISLVPEGAPVTIPAGGGPVTFTATVANTTAQTLSFEVWSAAVLPNNTLRLPLFGPVAVTLGPGQTLSRRLTQTVPGTAPAGSYTYVGYVGDFSALRVVDRSSFGGSKSGTRGGALSSEAAWAVVDAATGESVVAGEGWGGEVVEGLSAASSVAEGALVTVFPNPMVRQATVGFALPSAAEVRLAVYDVLGREVAVLADGRQEAGEHAVVFDGAGLAGGVYLVRLDVGGQVQTQRVTLLR